MLNNGIDTFRPFSLKSCTDSESAMFITDPENYLLNLTKLLIKLNSPHKGISREYKMYVPGQNMHTHMRIMHSGAESVNAPQIS